MPILTLLLKNHFLTTVVLLLLGWFLLTIKDLLVVLFISYIISTALFPFVAFFKRRKIPNMLAVLIPYLGFLSLLILLVIPLIPFFVSQVFSFADNLPVYLEQLNRLYGTNIDTGQLKNLISSELSTIGKNALAATGRVFGGLFTTLTILIISFYLLIDHDNLKNSFIGFFPANSQSSVNNLIMQIEEKLGAWLRGQLVLSLVIGTITWIALQVLGLEYALPLALIAGLLEIIPTLGPILSSIPAIIIALTISPVMVITVIILYTVIQLLENNLIVPKIMEKAVGLNPIVVIVSTLIGARLMGVMGALLSIPFVSLLAIVYKTLK